MADRIGDGATDFDMWTPNCSAALDYGYKTITVERIS